MQNYMAKFLKQLKVKNKPYLHKSWDIWKRLILDKHI